MGAPVVMAITCAAIEIFPSPPPPFGRLQTLTVVLPYYPTGTMERVTKEGQVATASTLARLFSNLPRIGKPIRVAVYDLHTLQNRFYLSGNALASMHSGLPLLLKKLGEVRGVPPRLSGYGFRV